MYKLIILFQYLFCNFLPVFISFLGSYNPYSYGIPDRAHESKQLNRKLYGKFDWEKSPLSKWSPHLWLNLSWLVIVLADSETTPWPNHWHKMHPPWFSAVRILHESTASIAIGPDFKPDKRKNSAKRCRIKTGYSGTARILDMKNGIKETLGITRNLDMKFGIN